METKTPLAILKDAKALLEKGWTQYTNAREGRKEVNWNNPNATCFCIVGAINRATFGDITSEFHNASPIVQDAMGDLLFNARKRATTILRTEIADLNGLPGWNDKPGRTQEEVIALFEVGIEKIERKDS